MRHRNMLIYLCWLFKLTVFYEICVVAVPALNMAEWLKYAAGSIYHGAEFADITAIVRMLRHSTQ